MEVDEKEDEGTSIQQFPDNVLELIFTHVNPYEDYNHAKLVSRRWYRIANGTQRRMERFFHKCVNFSWHFVEGDHLLSERCSHAACYHPGDYAMYIFGGCTNTYTAFNDLWLFDLSSHEWERVIVTRPPLPSPKALATMILYRGDLLLFGGFSKSSMNPIHQTNTFYNELHLFNRKTNCWEEVCSENTAPHLAGHSASIVGNFMLVFGGSMGSSYNNNVYVLDLARRIWNMPTIPGPCPPPRYGQSQLLLDDRHLLIIGGCGGPNLMFSDVWLLDFDLFGDSEWRWTQLKVENLEMTPPYTWCHKAEKIGNNAVVVSRPIKCHDLTSQRNSKRHGRRRTSSQSSASGGSGRLTSPDSPLDKKAVANAFCTGSFEQLQMKGRRVDERGKPILLTSRSLDDQQRDNASSSEAISAQSSSSSFSKSLQNSPSTSTNLAVSNSEGISTSLNTVSHQKTAGELHRACSIPAIIVGEIPKLIVTASAEPSSSSAAKSPIGSSAKRPHRGFTFTIGAGQENMESTSSNLPPVASQPSISISNKTSADSQAVQNTTKLEGDDPLHEYYVSLVRGEFNRLCIVELAENLVNVKERLNGFLEERIDYLSTEERDRIVGTFMQSLSSDGEVDRTKCPNLADSGQLRTRPPTRGGPGGEGGTRQRPQFHLAQQQANDAHPNAKMDEHGPSLVGSSASLFGPCYNRRLAVYILRLNHALSEHRVRWEQLPVEEDAPEDKLLYSLVVGRGELILFGICFCSNGDIEDCDFLKGGMQSDESGMDSLNVGLERRSMSADTFILRPRYNEM